MFWEFCTELQKGAVVGIMGPVKNRSWRVSSQLSPSRGHQLLFASFFLTMSSILFFLNLSNQGCLLSDFLSLLLMFFPLSIFSVLLFSLLMGFPTLAFSTAPFPKLIAFNECLEEPCSAPGPLCCDARGKYLTNHPLQQQQQLMGIRTPHGYSVGCWKQIRINAFPLQVRLDLTWCHCCRLRLPPLPPLSVSVMSCWASTGDVSKPPEASLEEQIQIHWHDYSYHKKAPCTNN